MIIEKYNPITRKLNKMDIPVTIDQLERWLRRDGLIQHIMPNLTPTQREFLLSGMSAEEQANFFKEKL